MFINDCVVGSYVGKFKLIMEVLFPFVYAGYTISLRSSSFSFHVVVPSILFFSHFPGIHITRLYHAVNGGDDNDVDVYVGTKFEFYLFYISFFLFKTDIK